MYKRQLDGTASGAARDRHVASYQWRVSGDTAALIGTGTEATARLKISAAGPFNVQLKVTDDVGAEDSTDVPIDAAAGSNGGGGMMHPLLLAGLPLVGLRRRRKLARC